MDERRSGSAGRVPAVVESYRDLAHRILDRPARLGRTRLVAVDGPSGAGKSFFAGRLARAVDDALASQAPGRVARPGAGEPTPTPVVHTDDLLDGWADQFTFWPRLEAWVLAPLRAGCAGRYQRYSWVRGRFTDRWIPVPVAPVVIVEGVSAARAGVAAELSFAVHVSAPEPLRRERALARDGPAILPHLETWWRRERRHFAADDPASRADLRVDSASPLPHQPDTEYVRTG